MIGKLLKGIEVAEVLNVSRAFAYRMMADGRIPTLKFGRSVRVRPEDLQTFMTESVSQRPSDLFAAKPIEIVQEPESKYG